MNRQHIYWGSLVIIALTLSMLVVDSFSPVRHFLQWKPANILSVGLATTLLVSPFASFMTAFQAVSACLALVCVLPGLERLLGSGRLILFYMGHSIITTCFWTFSYLIWNSHSADWSRSTLVVMPGVVGSMILSVLLNRTLVIAKVVRIPLVLVLVSYLIVEYLFFVADYWPVAIPVHLLGIVSALLFMKFVTPKFESSKTEPPKERKRPRADSPQPLFSSDQPPVIGLAVADSLPANLKQPLGLDLSVDAILEKITRLGQGSLTPEERKVLETESAELRRRKQPPERPAS